MTGPESERFGVGVPPPTTEMRDGSPPPQPGEPEKGMDPNPDPWWFSLHGVLDLLLWLLRW